MVRPEISCHFQELTEWNKWPLIHLRSLRSHPQILEQVPDDIRTDPMIGVTSELYRTPYQIGWMLVYIAYVGIYVCADYGKGRDKKVQSSYFFDVEALRMYNIFDVEALLIYLLSCLLSYSYLLTYVNINKLIIDAVAATNVAFILCPQ